MRPGVVVLISKLSPAAVDKTDPSVGDEDIKSLPRCQMPRYLLTNT